MIESGLVDPLRRLTAVNKIDQAILISGMNSSKSGTEMESIIYDKARDPKEYKTFISGVILHIYQYNSENINPDVTAFPRSDVILVSRRRYFGNYNERVKH